MSETVGVRELRQQASELIRRVEAGEDFIITVSGRPAARLVPLDYATADRTWRRVEDIQHLWTGSYDPTWLAEMEADANEEMEPMDDPWERAERSKRAKP